MLLDLFKGGLMPLNPFFGNSILSCSVNFLLLFDLCDILRKGLLSTFIFSLLALDFILINLLQNLKMMISALLI